MTRLERAIEEIKAIRTIPKEHRPWIYDDNGNIRDDVICGDIIPFLEDLKDYEINVSDEWIDKFIEESTDADNSYNWGANVDHDINFWWRKGVPIVLMMVHRLGDIRGNYTDKFAVKYDDSPRYEAIEWLLNNENTMQFKSVGEYSVDIDIFHEGYEVYDSKGESIGTYYEMGTKDLLEEIENDQRKAN